MSEMHTDRAHRLGTLIQEARLHAERTVEDCARQLGIDTATYEAIEAGEAPISLPELEVIALYLDVPMAYFWGSESLPAHRARDYGSMVSLRHRVIGVLLRQHRLEAGRSLEELADETGISAESLTAYESGNTPVPYLHLEQLSRALDLSVDAFVDASVGPLGKHEDEYQLYRIFNSLSPEDQAFLLKAHNTSFISIARRLSEMDVEQLRQIASSLLDITY